MNARLLRLLHLNLLKHLLAALTSAFAVASVHAEPNFYSPLDWQEAAIPPPPAFSTARSIVFEVSKGSDLRYGLVPETLSVGSDGVIRFVWVAQSRGGAVNVLYEGVRCLTREMRTYARWTPQQTPPPTPFTHENGEWRIVENSQWIGFMNHPQARPAWMLARIALCEGSTVAGSTQQMLRDLRLGRRQD
jgi:hypothetical protein